MTILSKTILLKGPFSFLLAYSQCSAYSHFFRDGTKVVTWQGGKSTLERNKYVIDLMCYSDRQHALRSACRDSQQQAISLLKLKKQHGRRR